MGKHTQNCTLIGKGVYGTIGVDQRSRLADGAHFHTMIVTSTLEASVIEGDKLVIKSGIVRCDGDIRVSSISGSGDIEVGGDIICDEITFTGKTTMQRRYRLFRKSVRQWLPRHPSY